MPGEETGARSPKLGYNTLSSPRSPTGRPAAIPLARAARSCNQRPSSLASLSGTEPVESYRTRDGTG